MHIASLKTHTIILGAGITGLSTAHFLSKKTEDFLVIEKNNKVGGNIHSQNLTGFKVENGPNTVLINNPSIQQLIKDCKLENDLIYPNESTKNNRYVLKQGKLQILPKKPIDILSTPILNWYEKISIIKDFFISKHNKNTSVSSFITKRFGKAVLNHFFEPFLTGIYAGDIDKMSAKHTLKKIWHLEQKYGSVIKGIKQQKNISNPSIFNFSNGLSHLTETIAKNIEKKLLLNQEIKHIKKLKNEYIITTNKNTIQSKRIISTIPAFSLSSIIEHKGLTEALNAIQYVPVDVFHFGFEKKKVKNQSQGFGVLTKPSDKKHFLGILFNNRIFPHVCSDDKDLFTVIVGGSKQSQLCQLPIEKLKPIILNEVKELLKCTADPIFSNHIKYKNGIPQYDLNHDEILNEIKEFENDNTNFHILGNYLNGVSVSDCIRYAHILVKKIKT